MGGACAALEARIRKAEARAAAQREAYDGTLRAGRAFERIVQRGLRAVDTT